MAYITLASQHCQEPRHRFNVRRNLVDQMLNFLFFATFLFMFTQPSWAMKQAHTEVDFISEAQSVAPGDSFWVALRMRMDPEWHVYWENAGDSGLPPEIKWMLPEGWKAGGIQWPVPTRINLGPLSSYGYEHEVLFLMEIHTSNQTPPDAPVELKARISWLACKVDCIPGKGELTLPVNISSQSVNDPAVVETFSKARARWPQSSMPWTALIEDAGKFWRMRFSGAPAPKDAWFFPQQSDVILHAGDQKLVQEADGFVLEIPKSNLLSRTVEKMPGILKVGETGFWVDAPLHKTGGAAPLSLIVACVFAVLGGLILNIMPCVLPVLSLKVIGLASHQHSRGESFRRGLIFAAGVIISFWILAGILLLIKNAGAQVGWGFQFQSPWFVGFMFLLFLVLSLNLFGLFEIGVGLTAAGNIASGSKGLWRDFLNGLLATVVATPCTAPFMGTAISYGLTQSPLSGFLIFTCLGVGMALPMVVLSAFPRLLKFLPKPGPWMNGMKRIMGVFMLASALWLFWVLALQLNVLSGTNNWREYSPQLIQELQQQKKDYFLDFTAAWCLTCQVNDRLVLQNRKVVEKFKEQGIILVKADWTKQDPAITSALEGYGRNSIPLYILYSAKTGKEENLGETITVQGLLDKLEHIK